MSEPSSGILGRISGKLLAPNLVRNGYDLTFRNQPLDPDLLYLDVNNLRVGLNLTPNFDLHFTAGKFTNSVVDSQLIIGNNDLILDNSQIASLTGSIIITPLQTANPIVFIPKNQTQQLEINNNYIVNYTTNGSIVLDARGSGEVLLENSTEIEGDLFVNGNITLAGNLSKQGNIILGDNILEDTVTINTDLTQDIVPGDDLLYDLGSQSKRWREAIIPIWNNIGTIKPNRTIVNNNLIIGQNLNNITTTNPLNDVLINPSSGTTFIESLSIQGGTITNLMQSPDIDPIKISAGLLANINGDPEGDIWNAIVTGRELFLGGGQFVETFRTAKLGDIRNDPDQAGSINNDDIDIILDIGNQQSSTLNEQLWYHTVIKSTILNDVDLYADYGITDTSLTNTTLTLSSTGIGYVKFDSTDAMVIPYGPTSERAYSEVGETRWNTDLGILECFDGNVYFVANGPGAIVTNDLMVDLAITRALVLG
jgi:hypothetical protein